MPQPLLFDLRGKRVYVAGHNGMAGSAIVRRLAGEGCEILTASRQALDLTQQSDTERWLEQMKPDAVILAAGHVGGIFANDTFPADFITDNLAIGLNVIRGSYKAGVKKLLALGFVLHLPETGAQPMSEDALLTGPLEPTNEWYAVAKIAAIKLCEAYRKQHGADFISAMPTNLYGRGDNYHPKNSHVPAALIRRFHEGKLANAPTVTVWGTGKPRREFLCSDDLADACVFLMKHYSGLGFLNVGTGEDVTIADFASEVARRRRLQGQDRVRYIPARRPAAETARRLENQKARLVAENSLHDGPGRRLCRFSGRRRRTHTATIRPKGRARACRPRWS